MKRVLFFTLQLLLTATLCYFFFFRLDNLDDKAAKGLLAYIPEFLKTDTVFHLLFFFGYPFLFFLINRLIWSTIQRNLFVSIAVSSFWIIAIEFIQPFFQRSFSVLDMVFGFLGLTVFVAGFHLFTRYRSKII